MSVSPFKVNKVRGALSRTLDFACLVSAFAATSSLASFLSRSDLFIWPEPVSADIGGWPAQYVVLLLSTVIAWNVVSGYLRIHRGEPPDASSNNFGSLLRAGLLWMAATALAIFLFKLREVSRLFVLSYIVLASALIALRDWGEMTAARRIYRSGRMRRTAVVIGNGAQANWLRQFLLDNYCPEPYALVRQVGPADPDYIDGQATPGTNGHQASSRDATEVFVAAADIGADVSGLLPGFSNEERKRTSFPVSSTPLSLGWRWAASAESR